MDDDLIIALIRNEIRIEKRLTPDCRQVRFVVGRRQGLGWRIDRYLRAAGQRWPPALITKWCEEGRATVDGAVVGPGHCVKPGERVELRVPIPPPEPGHEPPPLAVLWRDRHLCVLNKPTGQLAHQAGKALTGTLLNQLQDLAFAEKADPHEVRLVNRIDRETSGIVLASLSLEAHRRLSAAMDAGDFHKEYRAICLGVPQPPEGDWQEPLGALGPHTIRHGVVEGGQPSHTGYRVVEAVADGTHALLHLVLHTGRQHQIRIHASHHGHPLVGDWVYGRPIAELPGQALHAAILEFPHPFSGQRIRVEAPLPPVLAALWERLRTGWQPTAVALAPDQLSKLGQWADKDPSAPGGRAG